jgi:shikimate kinase
VTPERIVLVGFMGAGKTTVGRQLAKRLGWSFLDLDAWIEGRHGLSVARLFETQGEPFFRDEELRAAEHTRQLRHYVIAAGGGAFAQPATREALRAGATTVWLRCDLATVEERVAAEGASRPLAADRERMRALLAGREPHYRLADLTVDTTHAPAHEVAARIVTELFPGREPLDNTGR